MMIEASRLRVPYAADVDREVGAGDHVGIARAQQAAARKHEIEHGDAPDVVGVEFSGVGGNDHDAGFRRAVR